MSFAQNPTANAVAGWIVIAIIGFKIASFSGCGSGKEKGGDVPGTLTLSEPSNGERAQNVAETMVLQMLKAPATARFESFKVLKKEHPWYQLLTVVDAQNSFGALVRESYVCTFKLEPDRKFTSNRQWGVQEHREIPGAPAEVLNSALQFYREESGWGKPPKT